MIKYYTYESYRKLEHKFVQSETARIADILYREIQQLDRVVVDYANWDDTYTYMAKPNKQYIIANYSAETLTNLEINRISLIDTNQNIVFDRWFNFAQEQRVMQSFPQISLQNQAGLVICPQQQVFILSVHNILPSNKQGQPRGWLLMARAVDKYRLKKLSQEARVEVEIHPHRQFNPRDEIISNLDSNGFAIKALGRDKIAGYTYLDTINNSPPLVLKVITHRYIYQQFMVGLQFLAIAIFIISISATALVLLLLDRLFLARLSQLDQQVQIIKANPDVLPELKVIGKDELADLSIAIQEMLKVIEETKIAIAANKIRTEFISIMNHELRTPMNAVLGMAQLLQTTTLDAEQEEYVTSIIKSGNQLLGLMNDIINYIHLGSSFLTRENCSIRSILSDLQAKYLGVLSKKDLQLHLEISPDLPTIVTTDGNKLQEILDRLLDNAIKFTPAGEIRIRVNYQPLTDGKGNVVLTIADTGIGIKQEDWQRIFDPFVMVDTSATRAQGGTGMGLAIVQRLCEVMGATIQIESEVGKGTKFIISLLVEEAHLTTQPLMGVQGK
ncbi:MAG: ATP-binding protein [Pseudanabaenaceae cyanobacterium]